VEKGVVDTPNQALPFVYPSSKLSSFLLCRWVQVAVSGDLCSSLLVLEHCAWSQPRAGLGLIFLDSHSLTTFSYPFSSIFRFFLHQPPAPCSLGSSRRVSDSPLAASAFRIVALPFCILCHWHPTFCFISPRITFLYLATFRSADERTRYDRDELLGLQRAGHSGPPQQLPALIRQGMSSTK
jgi:hypothetical protein